MREFTLHQLRLSFKHVLQKNYGDVFRRLSCLCISFAKNDKRRKLKDIMKVAAL